MTLSEASDSNTIVSEASRSGAIKTPGELLPTNWGASNQRNEQLGTLLDLYTIDSSNLMIDDCFAAICKTAEY